MTLAGFSADLDLGDDGAVLPLDGGQLVHTAEHRLALGGDKPLTHPKAVDTRPPGVSKSRMIYSSSELEAIILMH